MDYFVSKKSLFLQVYVKEKKEGEPYRCKTRKISKLNVLDVDPNAVQCVGII